MTYTKQTIEKTLAQSRVFYDVWMFAALQLKQMSSLFKPNSDEFVFKGGRSILQNNNNNI